jgi:3-oxoacyl-ACP reductase-like protein
MPSPVGATRLTVPPADEAVAPPAESPAPVAPVIAETSAPSDTPAPAALAEALSDPQNLERIGRVALASVGNNPNAEQVWLFAINNPALSSSARKNLIEDLNQEGLSNPQNPAPEDLPLIESRIALIDRIAPAAMDGVNAAAFQIAMTDLTAMRGKLLQK